MREELFAEEMFLTFDLVQETIALLRIRLLSTS